MPPAGRRGRCATASPAYDARPSLLPPPREPCHGIAQGPCRKLSDELAQWRCIWASALIGNGFLLGPGVSPDLHPQVDLRKVQPFAVQPGKNVTGTLAHRGCHGTRRNRHNEARRRGLRHADVLGQHSWQVPAYRGGEAGFLLHALLPPGKERILGEDAAQGAGWGLRHRKQASVAVIGAQGAVARGGRVGSVGAVGRGARARVGEAVRVNIILVADAHAKARSITLDWRHWTAASLVLLAILLTFTLVFNFITLRWAAATQHPWLAAIALADQREAAAKVHDRVQGHLNAMAVRLGEMQAQMLRLETVGERLARTAGLKPSDMPSMDSSTVPGRGGALSSLPSRNLSMAEFGGLVDTLSREISLRQDQFSVLETMVLNDSADRKFMPTLQPVENGWFSSNFGYRIDPFTGQQSLHEGIDFPGETGTPILATASGKVVAAESHPAYGKMVEIDHGNGLVSRYAHTSALYVKVGDLVVRGQKIAAIGTTGRSTGPHLHFEVRLNGVPQNPARFLQASARR